MRRNWKTSDESVRNPYLRYPVTDWQQEETAAQVMQTEIDKLMNVKPARYAVIISAVAACVEKRFDDIEPKLMDKIIKSAYQLIEAVEQK